MPPDDELLDELELLLLEDDEEDDELLELDEVSLPDELELAEATVTIGAVDPSVPPPPHADSAIANAPVRPYR